MFNSFVGEDIESSTKR